jgi:glycosidase
MRHRLAGLAVLAACLACAPAAPTPRQSAAPALAPDTSWVRRSGLYEVFVRDFSPQGTFRGLRDGLDRIAASGADVLWLMPIHPIGVKNRKGTFGSPYAVKDYRAVNPDYGTLEDFRQLVEAVHAKGMKLILDFVPNHTAADHPWVTEHPEYYHRNERGEPETPRDETGKLTDWTDVVALDYGNPSVRREIIAAMRYWLVEYGIDGFRVDVAGFIPKDFWREATPQLRAAVRHPILLLAEWGDHEMHRVGFDLTYAWDSYKRLKAVWKGEPASSFVEGELPDMQAMPPGGMRMRFTTNHDESAWDDPPMALFDGSAGARAAYVAIALLPGRPLLYNGQEIESPQKLALFEKEAIAWDSGPPNEDSHLVRSLLSAVGFYHSVVKVARHEPDLLSRDFRAVETSAAEDVIAYRRGNVLVLVNSRPRSVTVKVSGFPVSGSRYLLSGARERSVSVEQSDSVTFQAYGFAVLKAR